MLIRLLVIVKPRRLKTVLQRSLNLPDVIIQQRHEENFIWERIPARDADVIVVSKELIPEPQMQSIAFLLKLPDPPSLVIFSQQDDPQERAKWLSAGCEAVLHSNLPVRILQSTLAAIIDRHRSKTLADLTGRRMSPQARLSDFVSYSPAMHTFMKMTQRVVNSDAPLLILGETGVGKERLTRAIHADGPRSSGPFIAVNCGALPETLLESELFGHEEGAFTGATRYRRGCFELAHHGTIFLDEISEMPLHLQVKLLRVLQEYEILPVGGERPIKIDARVTASTNRNLEKEVKEGRFRMDLYYRLSVVSLVIPPLRERREDIPTLVQNYIDFLRPRIGAGKYAITPQAMDALSNYSWPGNVRELINIVERAMLLCDRETITQHDFPESISAPPLGPSLVVSATVRSINPPGLTEENLNRPWRQVRRTIVDRAEKEYLSELLRLSNGRVGEAARRAGIQPRSLHDKMKKHGLQKETFKKF
jgi:two-component system, NtrC family, response regulator AtoC